MGRGFYIMGAALGLLGVLAGTFGAHGLGPRLSEEDRAIWETAARYHMIHALALWGVAYGCERFSSRAMAAAGWLFLAGVLVFSSSLYLLAGSTLLFGARQSWLGAINRWAGFA